MKYRIVLRLASILSFMHGAMHQIGTSTLPTDNAALAVVGSMKSFQMDAMGSLRSYWDFYAGMGLLITITLITFGALLWLLSNVKANDRHIVRPLLLVIGLTFSIFAITSIKFLFLAPIIMEALIAAFVLFAYFNSQRVA